MARKKKNLSKTPPTSENRSSLAGKSSVTNDIAGNPKSPSSTIIAKSIEPCPTNGYLGLAHPSAGYLPPVDLEMIRLRNLAVEQHQLQANQQGVVESSTVGAERMATVLSNMEKDLGSPMKPSSVKGVQKPSIAQHNHRRNTEAWSSLFIGSKLAAKESDLEAISSVATSCVVCVKDNLDPANSSNGMFQR